MIRNVAGGLRLFVTQPVVLTEPSEKNLTALRRALVRATSFALFLVIADGGARAETRARLQAWSGKDGVPELAFFSDGEAGAEEVQTFLAEAAKQPLSGAAILDGDTLVAKETPVLALNVARDRLGELIAGPLVIILAPRREVELSRMAADLFDVRSATYVVEEEPSSAAERSLSAALGAMTLEAAVMASSPLKQIASAHARKELPDPEALRALEASPEPPTPTALADLWLEQAIALDEQHWSNEAAEAAAEVVRLAEPQGYRSAVSLALRIQATALQRNGHLMEAEQVLQRALSLADGERQRASTQSAIADLLEARGQLDEALRIRREDVLPVYERSGDIRGRAMAMVRVASILEAQGQIEEALRILQQDALPVFQSLGDIRSRMITMERIANVLATRGQRGEALRILQQDVLPVAEHLDDRLTIWFGRTAIALLLLLRDQPGDRDEAARLLHLALADAEALRIPAEVATIRDIIEENGLGDPGRPDHEA